MRRKIIELATSECHAFTTKFIMCSCSVSDRYLLYFLEATNISIIVAFAEAYLRSYCGQPNKYVCDVKIAAETNSITFQT